MSTDLDADAGDEVGVIPWDWFGYQEVADLSGVGFGGYTPHGVAVLEASG